MDSIRTPPEPRRSVKRVRTGAGKREFGLAKSSMVRGSSSESSGSRGDQKNSTDRYYQTRQSMMERRKSSSSNSSCNFGHARRTIVKKAHTNTNDDDDLDFSNKPRPSGQRIQKPGSSVMGAQQKSEMMRMDGRSSDKYINSLNLPTPGNLQHQFVSRGTRECANGVEQKQPLKRKVISSSLEELSAPSRPLQSRHSALVGPNEFGWKEKLGRPRPVVQSTRRQSSFGLGNPSDSKVLPTILNFTESQKRQRLRRCQLKAGPGTADQPIDLDSDSEAEETKRSSTEKKSGANDGHDADDSVQLRNCRLRWGREERKCDVTMAAHGMKIQIKERLDTKKPDIVFWLRYDGHSEVHLLEGNAGDVKESLNEEEWELNCPFIALKQRFVDNEIDQLKKTLEFDPALIRDCYIVICLSKESVQCFSDALAVMKENAVSTVDFKEVSPTAREKFLPPLRQTRSSRRNYRLVCDATENDKEYDDVLFTYPFPPCTSDIVTITRRDARRCSPARFLNDNIVDYYYRRLMVEVFKDNPQIQQDVVFLSSHFFSRLRSGTGKTAVERLTSGYAKVSTWATRRNVFEREMIFVPVNEDIHWSLAVVVNPRGAAVEDVGENVEPNPKSWTSIALLDPLGNYHSRSSIMRQLKSFLRLEWQKSGLSKSEYHDERVLLMNVNVPRQENSTDCGVYILKYAQVILERYCNLTPPRNVSKECESTMESQDASSSSSSSSSSAAVAAANNEADAKQVEDENDLLVDTPLTQSTDPEPPVNEPASATEDNRPAMTKGTGTEAAHEDEVAEEIEIVSNSQENQEEVDANETQVEALIDDVGQAEQQETSESASPTGSNEDEKKEVEKSSSPHRKSVIKSPLRQPKSDQDRGATATTTAIRANNNSNNGDNDKNKLKMQMQDASSARLLKQLIHAESFNASDIVAMRKDLRRIIDADATTFGSLGNSETNL